MYVEQGSHHQWLGKEGLLKIKKFYLPLPPFPPVTGAKLAAAPPLPPLPPAVLKVCSSLRPRKVAARPPSPPPPPTAPVASPPAHTNCKDWTQMHNGKKLLLRLKLSCGTLLATSTVTILVSVIFLPLLSGCCPEAAPCVGSVLNASGSLATHACSLQLPAGSTSGQECC